ncbi:MAG: hypothetical protein ACR5K9_00160 [Wolbachia sp.]
MNAILKSRMREIRKYGSVGGIIAVKPNRGFRVMISTGPNRGGTGMTGGGLSWMTGEGATWMTGKGDWDDKREAT